MEDKKLSSSIREDYEKGEEFKRMIIKGSGGPDIYDGGIDFLSSFDPSAELPEENGSYGLKTPLGRVIVTALFENFLKMTNQELKNGDRVVAQKDDKNGGLCGVVNEWDAFTESVFEVYGGGTDDGPVEVKYNVKWGFINE